MDLRVLEYFLMTAEEGSITHAAELLHVSQPTVSRQLMDLERELGRRFVRVHRAYLAAWDKIESVDWKEQKVRVGGRTCLLSRAGKAELKKKLGGNL